MTLRFKTYEVEGYPTPLRLSPEHAEALGGVEVDASGADAPTKRATKAAWAEYAVAQGMDYDAAQAATRAQLIEQYG